MVYAWKNPVRHKSQTDPEIKHDIFKRVLAQYQSPELSLWDFFKQAWEILEPANILKPNWHLELLCEYLMKVGDGTIRKLLINMPPRNGKSGLVTITFPVWLWTRRPSMRFIFCSYSASLSTKHSLDRRRLIESQWFREKWGGIVKLSEDQNQKHEYENTARGHMISTSVGGTLTGKGGDIIIEDDMLNSNDADSLAARTHSQSMHKNVLPTRLDDPMTGSRILVEQRTHPEDVSGYILKHEKDWDYLCLPMEAIENMRIVFPISGKVVERPQDSLLNPLHYGPNEVKSLKNQMGSRSYAAQCQQNPTSELGNILKRHWWKSWHTLPPGFDIVIHSWDMTFKETKTGSYVCGQIWGKRSANYYLIDQVRARMDFNDSMKSLELMAAKYPMALGKLVEGKANGPAIISTLKNKISGIIEVNPIGTKAARAQNISPIVEAGNVHLPAVETHPWVADYIEECAAFKGVSSERNDQVDAMTQAIYWLSQLDAQVPVVDDGLGESILDQADSDFVGSFNGGYHD